MKTKLHHSNPRILLHCRHLSCHTLNCNCGKIYAYAFLCFATLSVVGFEMNYDVNVCLCSFGLHRSRPCLCIIGGSRPYLSFLGISRLDLDLGNELKPIKRSFPRAEEVTTAKLETVCRKNYWPGPLHPNKSSTHFGSSFG